MGTIGVTLSKVMPLSQRLVLFFVVKQESLISFSHFELIWSVFSIFVLCSELVLHQNFQICLLFCEENHVVPEGALS